MSTGDFYRYGNIFDPNRAASRIVSGAVASGGSGAMGVAIVFACDDAEKLRSLMAENMKLQQTIMAAAFPDAEGKAVWSFTHTKDAATIEGVAVDRIDIPLVGMDEGQPEVRQQIEALFGSGELSLLIAAANDKTLVMTLGGGEAMMGQALKVAAGGGTIGSSKAVAAALADVPTDAMFVGVFSLKNFGAFVQTVMDKVVLPDADQFPLLLESGQFAASDVFQHEGDSGILPQGSRRRAVDFDRLILGEEIELLVGAQLHPRQLPQPHVVEQNRSLQVIQLAGWIYM